MTRRATVIFMLAIGALLLVANTPSRVSAQPVRYGVSAGVAVPAGDYGARGIGPLVRASATWGEVPRHVHLRADIEATILTSQSATGAVRTVSAMLNYLVGGKSARFSPYGYVGGGAQVISVSGASSATQWAPDVRAGVGIRARNGSGNGRRKSHDMWRSPTTEPEQISEERHMCRSPSA